MLAIRGFTRMPTNSSRAGTFVSHAASFAYSYTKSTIAPAPSRTGRSSTNGSINVSIDV